MNVNRKDVILTGLARSGTTLVCNLLNRLPCVIALNEPTFNRSSLESRDTFSQEVDKLFEVSRQSLLKTRTAISRQIEGQIPDNPFEEQKYKFFHWFLNWLADHKRVRFTKVGARKLRASQNEIIFDKDLSDDFLLCIKHNPPFTALLDNLNERYPCYAIFRNPLATMASWNSVALPVSDGHAPAAEVLDTDLSLQLGVSSQ